MGYSFKAIAPINNTTPGATVNIDVFTVPASHTYLIKGLDLAMTADASTATTAKIQVSENTGTTFYDVTNIYSTGAVTGNTKMVSLAIPYTSVADTATSSTTTGTRTVTTALHNMILEAGQKLRIVKGGSIGGGSTPIINAFCSVIDYV